MLCFSAFSNRIIVEVLMYILAEYRERYHDITCLKECISNSQKGSLIYMKTGASLSHLNSSCIRSLQFLIILSRFLSKLQILISCLRGQRYGNGWDSRGTSTKIPIYVLILCAKTAFVCIVIFITLHFICEYTRITTLIVKPLPHYACMEFKPRG